MVIEVANIPEEAGGDKENTDQNVTTITKTTHNKKSTANNIHELVPYDINPYQSEEFEMIDERNYQLYRPYENPEISGSGLTNMISHE